MKRVLLIGYGNTIRSDDGAGYRAAELIESLYPEVDVIISHDLKPEYSEAIANHEIIFFVDASIDSNKLEIKKVDPENFSIDLQTHFSNPQSLITQSILIYNKKPSEVYLVKLPAYNFDFGEMLSVETKKSIDDFIKWFYEFLKTLNN